MTAIEHKMEYLEYWAASAPQDLGVANKSQSRVNQVANHLGDGWTLINVAVVAVADGFVIGYFFTRFRPPAVIRGGAKTGV